MGEYLKAGAVLSHCGKYRYRLWREWRLGNSPHWDMFTDEAGKPIVDGAGEQWGEPKSCLFIMLNPSTADAEQDDPTIRRCVAFAKAWGYDRMEVVNLFAWRATDPSEVLAMTAKGDPIGRDNQRHVELALDDAGLVVCAWGAHGGHIGQDETMLGWIDGHWADPIPHALKVTKHGFPAHPLYLRADLKPSPYGGCNA
ncbi:DUF1643 domain-containing protein [Sphingomonas paeninsulae]|uniref:DUF1643 domain-containing protein n=1 Tax=Sphingomonas paeninsulae TaxID=2319844 RepID=A0A494TLB9_SPHPE|nr:DUF1643 domain-containing protein [Sphingomonas paeninsulae]AYJ85746.1 DUF1643 domain-containing protein [Sphingomonas paeninsulae]AYJ86218.1 DUF1643 domain-containing protein [Sphingomonas paeninsulae]